MPGHIDWDPGPFRDRLDAELERRCRLAGAVVRTHARVLVGRPGTRRLRSRPGAPPRRQTGTLLLSIGHRNGRAAGRVYAAIVATAPWAIHLSRGTPKMAPRPFLTTALADLRETIRSILVRGD